MKDYAPIFILVKIGANPTKDIGDGWNICTKWSYTKLPTLKNLGSLYVYFKE